MNIKISFFLSLLLSNTTYTMKRELQNPKMPNNHKKQKLNNPSCTSLLTFFASNKQLKKAWGNIAQEAKNNGISCDNPQNYRAKTIVANTPLDIKKNIAQQSIFTNQAWWHTTNKLSYNALPYGISLLDNDTLLVGLYNGQLKIIDLISNKELSSFKTDNTLFALTTNTKKDTIACGFSNGTVQLLKIHKTEIGYDLEPLRELKTNSPVWSLDFTNNNDIVIGQENGKIVCVSEDGKKLFSYKTNNRVYGVITQTDPQLLIYGLVNGNISLQNIHTNNTEFSSYPLKHTDELLALSSFNNKETYAIGTTKGWVYFADTKNNTPLKSFNLHNAIYSLSLNSTGDHLVAGLDNYAIHVLKHYTSPTPDQIMLKKAIRLWTQVEKPYKSINSADLLLYMIADKFKLNHAELTHIWNTFPKEIQSAIWLNAKRIIYKYGKKQQSLTAFCNTHNLSTIKLCNTPSIEKYQTDDESRSRHNKIRRIIHFWQISNHPTITPINSIDSLFTTISVIYNLRKIALKNIWNTFPEKTQSELINHYIPQQK